MKREGYQVIAMQRRLVESKGLGRASLFFGRKGKAPMQHIEVEQPKYHHSQHKVGLLDAAPILGVSPYTLRAWVRQRKIPFYRCGRRIVFAQADIEQFLAECRVAPQEPALQ